MTLGPYCAAPSFVLYADDLFDMSRYFRMTSGVIPILQNGLSGLRYLDRLLVGEDWMALPDPVYERGASHRFLRLQGGVGRSTALAVVAHLRNDEFLSLILTWSPRSIRLTTGVGGEIAIWDRGLDGGRLGGSIIGCHAKSVVT